MRERDRFVIIGAGKVGTAMAHLLQQKGEEVVAVISRSEESLKQASRYVEGVLLATDLLQAAGKGNTYLITTPDDMIIEVCLNLASGNLLNPGDRVVHMSGALGLDVLESGEEKGARVLSLHPLQTFADIQGAIRKIPGTVFAITARNEAMEKWAERLVRKLGGVPVLLAEKDKALYHIGAVMACNLLISLEHAAELLYQDIGMKGDMALSALFPLIAGTVDNLKKLGTEKALTGPIARGDIGIIRRHLEVLEDQGSEAMLKAYVSLSLFALDLARSHLSKARADELEELLRHYL
jgi:predicted short-subunit dehydrogenase-like oxidoreductase (DUF2520 family)